jgi:hypothetical protein
VAYPQSSTYRLKGLSITEASDTLTFEWENRPTDSPFHTDSGVRVLTTPVTLRCAICGERAISANLRQWVIITFQVSSSSTTEALTKSLSIQGQFRLIHHTLEDISLCSHSLQCQVSSLRQINTLSRLITLWENGELPDSEEEIRAIVDGEGEEDWRFRVDQPAQAGTVTGFATTP